MGSISPDFVISADLSAGEERRLLRDCEVPTLFLDISPAGKVWRSARNVAGKRRLSFIADATTLSLEDARRIAIERGREEEEDEKSNATAMPFRDFVETVYGPHAKTVKRSHHQEMRVIRNHILPALGDRPIAAIGKAEIRALLQSKVAAGYGPSMVNRILATVKSIFSRAVDWETEGVKESPARGIRQLPCPNRIDAFLTPAEAQRLQVAVAQSENPLLRHIIAFLLLTGGRKREALDARWENVDFDRRIFTVPLSKSGRPRYIPLSDEAIRVLHAARRELARVAPEIAASTPWIFPNPETGKPFVNIFTSWNNARKRAGLDHIRVHDLRHSFASALVNEGMTLYDVKEILGHANMATTTRYAHLSRERLRQAATVASDHYKLKI